MGAIRPSKPFWIAAVSLVFLLASATQSKAEDYALADAYLHSFNTNIDVYTGVFALNKDLNLETSLYFRYTVDIIETDSGGGDDDGGGNDDALLKWRSIAQVSGASSATTPAVSASGKTAPAGDTRNDVLAGLSHNFSNFVTVDAYFDYSKEQDYTSRTPIITLKKELFEKNTTLTFGYSRNIDDIEGYLMDSPDERNTDNYYFGVTQLLSPVTIVQAGFSRSDSSGLLSEGIRLVPVDGTTAASCTAESATCIEEALPNSRRRNAYMAGVNHYFAEGLGGLLDRSSVKITARYYDDDWDVASYLGEAEFNKYLTEDLLLRLNYRYYTQTQAFFVKHSYLSTDEFKSSSPQLEELDSQLTGLKAVYIFNKSKGEANLIDLGSVEAKYEYYTQSNGTEVNVFMAGLRLLF